MWYSGKALIEVSNKYGFIINQKNSLSLEGICVFQKYGDGIICFGSALTDAIASSGF